MLEVTFEETYLESRKIRFNKDTTSQTIVGIIHGNFIQEAQIGPQGLYNDDIIAIQAAYQYIPIAYEVPSYSGFSILLVIQSLELEQINYSTWKVTATYDVPSNGGKSGGGMGQQVPNTDPDATTENFTQISVNLAASTRNRKFSRQVLECHKRFDIGGPAPYPIGQPAPIGHTEDGIEGVDVYEREFGFSITAFFPPEKITYKYLKKISALHGTINRNTFFGFPWGSVLFLEMDFSSDLYQVVPVTFSFKQRNNYKFSFVLPDTIASWSVPPEDSFDIYFEPDFPDSEVVPGWSDVDYRYTATPDPAKTMMLQRPVVRTIHLNYLYSDFENFEI